MAQGVPVVTTSVGSEGMLFEDEQELVVRDSATEFAAAAVELARNSERWQRLAVAGKKAVSLHYSPESVRRRRNDIYSILMQAKQASPQTAHGV
jgi:glycosyltransferase involved in cell wall biosynthesis